MLASLALVLCDRQSERDRALLYSSLSLTDHQCEVYTECDYLQNASEFFMRYKTKLVTGTCA
jgi:hypothetical protein